VHVLGPNLRPKQKGTDLAIGACWRYGELPPG
jgi:hypothetical protein